MFKKQFMVIQFVLFLIWLAVSCGSTIDKSTLTADAYFDYAKSKFDKGKYLDAITEFTVIVLKFSGDPVVDDAQYYLAESHFKQKEYLIATSEYEKLIKDYPQSPYNVLAQFKIGLAYKHLSLRPALDQEYTNKAYRQFQSFVELNPDHELRASAEKYIAELREKLARKKLLAATTYRKMGIYDAAVVYYNIILEKYYDCSPAAAAQFWKGECLYRQDKYIDAQNSFTIFVEKYPGHKYVSRAKSRIEKIADQLKTSQSEN